MPAATLTAQAAADLVGGRLSGPGDILVERTRSLSAAGPRDVAACSSHRWSNEMAQTAAAVVLIPSELAAAPGPATRIVVSDPMRAIAILATVLHPREPRAPVIAATAHIGVDVSLGEDVVVGHGAVIETGARVGNRACIGAHVVVERGVVIGADVQLDPHVVVQEGSVLGDRVYCQSGAVIGSPGFGFHSSSDGHVRVPQVGGCFLADDVEVGAGSCIDRGSLEDTVIGRGTKIDNLVHVGHNVHIGEHCLIMAGVGISGSTQIGDRVILAGQAGLVGHIVVGDDARIGAQAGVIADVPTGAAVSGYPARPHREFLRAQAALYRLTHQLSAIEDLVRDADA